MDDARVTCLLVDDHPAILKAASATLRDDGIDIIGRVERTAEALEVIERRRPAVALVDLRLPDGTGIDLIRKVTAAAPRTACLVYSGYAASTQLREAIDAGARGFVSKEAPMAELSRAVTTVADGGRYVDPLLGGELAARDRLPALTPRERDVLRCLSEGMSNSEIGAHLYLSSETVRGYVSNACERIGARNRTQAVAIALRLGLIG